MTLRFRQLLVAIITLTTLIVPFTMAGQQVVVDITTPNDNGAPVTKDHKYSSHVTLYIENADKTKTPSGWSTRVSDGAAADKPFQYQPGVGLIEGWTEGVLQMKEGERAMLHVPAALGYGARPMGSPGGAFYIPGGSDLLFDIEILGKVGGSTPDL
jgi:peptidylprolyl isomerase